MLISAKLWKVQPAIAQLEERRFVIGNRSLTTLGPVFESRWLDFFPLRSLVHFLSYIPPCAQSAGDESITWLLMSCRGDEAQELLDASHLNLVKCEHSECEVYPGIYGNV